jgi:plastocyanin
LQLEFSMRVLIGGFLGALFAFLMVSPIVPARADDGPVTITITGGKFVPSEVSIPAGTKVKLIVRNQDGTASEFESVDFHREKVVPAGDEISVFVGPLDAGTYEFFDDFHPDNRGHLTVR